MKNFFKLKLYVLVLFTVALVFKSCTDEFGDGLVTDVSVNIEAFAVNGIVGEIDQLEDKITVILPYGTNVTAVVPQVVVAEGAIVTPVIGTTVNFTNPVEYTVKNGNIYKKYEVTVKSENPIKSFVINGQSAEINNTSKTITLTLPEGTNFSALTPVIELATGVSISPASGSVVDFANPVNFNVTNGIMSEVYVATVAAPISGPQIAFIGTEATRSLLSNLDEIAASDWLFNRYSGAKYISFAEVAAGVSLDNFDVIWWHFDSAVDLPAEATSSAVLARIQNYLINGGNILLTSFASQYADKIGILPAGKGPNNVFGDFPPDGFVDSGSDWGISFVGNEDHPIFNGVETYATGKANLLQKGTFRLNHTAWWFLPEWGGYENGAGWREQTGGKNLASEAWDDTLDGRVAISEFPGTGSQKNCVIISMGAYDWYNENNNGVPSAPNGFIDNIKKITDNSLNYLVNH